MSTESLTGTSYVVLGLIEQCQPVSVYELKQVASISVFNFWALPHTVLYTETERLAKKGLLDRNQERTGRRKRTYRLTEAGQEELDSWRSEPTDDLCEVRDRALLQLFCGADPEALADVQIRAHQAKLDEYLELRERLAGGDTGRGTRLALEAGIGIEQQMISFWRSVAEERV